MVERTGADPSEQSIWLPLYALLKAMDNDIAALYAEAGVGIQKPSWVKELLRLHYRGPMTITELAAAVQRTHSGTSQKVAAMRDAGLVRTTAGPDARSKRVELTEQAERLIPRLAAEWRATEAASAELEAEIAYPLSRVVTDIEAALARRSFHDRIAARLAEDPDWTGAPELIITGRGGAGRPAHGPLVRRWPGAAGTPGHRKAATTEPFGGIGGCG